MAMLAAFAYVRVLYIWSYWLFSKVAKVANIPTGGEGGHLRVGRCGCRASAPISKNK
jgi:hypothetical protein